MTKQYEQKPVIAAEWKKDGVAYDGTPAPKPLTGLLRTAPDGINTLFGFDVVGDKNQLYLYTKNAGPGTPDFTFDLLFVQKTAKTVDGVSSHYGVTVSGDYIHSSGLDTDGVVNQGTGYWDVTYTLPTGAKTSLGTDYEIYMIIKWYSKLNLTDSGKNVIKIK